MSKDPSAAGRNSGRNLLAGGSLLSAATLAAGVGNYGLNVVLGRWMSPSQFADANLVVTLMLLVTAVAISFQLLTARFTSRHHATGASDDAERLERWLENLAFAVGVVMAVAMTFGAQSVALFFNSPSAWPFAILGWGLPFYLAQGVGRGALQGRLRFGALAATYLVEVGVRLGVAIPLVAAGFGVAGASFGLSISFVVTWFVVRGITGRRAAGPAPAHELRRLLVEVGPVAILLAGQIVINNQDVLWVKRTFEPEIAGAYAVVALVGRAVFFLSWSVVSTVFPASTRRDSVGASSASLLWTALAAVLLIGLAAIVGSVVAGEEVIGSVFGSSYVEISRYLPWYAGATTLFAAANLFASYELSVGRSLGPVLVLSGAALQSSLLFVLGGSLDGVIAAQVAAMAVLAVATTIIVGQRINRPTNHPNQTYMERGT